MQGFYCFLFIFGAHEPYYFGMYLFVIYSFNHSWEAKLDLQQLNHKPEISIFMGCKHSCILFICSPTDISLEFGSVSVLWLKDVNQHSVAINTSLYPGAISTFWTAFNRLWVGVRDKQWCLQDLEIFHSSNDILERLLKRFAINRYGILNVPYPRPNLIPLPTLLPRLLSQKIIFTWMILRLS